MSVGSLLSGYVIKLYGVPIAFQLYGMATGVMSVICLIFELTINCKKSRDLKISQSKNSETK